MCRQATRLLPGDLNQVVAAIRETAGRLEILRPGEQVPHSHEMRPRHFRSNPSLSSSPRSRHSGIHDSFLQHDIAFWLGFLGDFAG